MLTLYYAGSTFLQSWRIQKVCNKIAEQLSHQTSVAFYALQPGNDDGFDTAFATSELCVNRNAAKVTEILWLHGNQRGCCVQPLQKLHITPWISFQAEPSWLPFAHETGGESLAAPALADDKSKRINLLLEANIEPTRLRETDEDEIRLEEYGKLIAWKIDSHLAVLIETDVEHFTKLLISTFLRNNLFINDQLPLLRIESVQHDGKPQPFELLAEHLRRSTRTTAELSEEAWQQHLSDLRALSVLAHQATEFEYNKNKTEGKTGVVKPDLIPQEKKAVSEIEKDKQTCVDATKASPVKAADNSTMLIKAETEASASNVNVSGNVSKMKAKPTEIKKPGASVTDGRFTSTRVSESPPSKTLPPESAKPSTKTSTKTSELEKIAAASLTKKKSPVHAISSSQESTPTSSAASKATTATPQKSVPIVPKITVETPTKLTTPKSTNEISAAVTEQPKGITPKQPTTATIDNTKSATASQQPPSSSSVSSSEANAKRPVLRRNKDSLQESKPLNVLVYSDTLSARDSTVATLRELLKPDMYTVYAMTPQEVEQKYWLDQTALLVVCGSVAPPIGEILVDYFLHGGKVLSLCSDILHFILPTYRTAEVREHELVQFSYDKWHKVKMMHHIFCYQPSPVKKHFSTDSEDSSHSRKPALVCPRSIELKDLTGQPYKLDVQVLGTEETWNTPSLLLASSFQSGGKAVFSQVHLETNPTEFEFDESKFSVLKQSEKIRLEIFADLLRKYLSVEVRDASNDDYTKGSGIVYKQAYFLGRHESKFELIEKLKSQSGSDEVISSPNLTLRFVDKNEQIPSAGRNLLPILIHSCPEDFSTVEYFDNLKTKDIGRLVIYAPVVSSSVYVVGNLELTHGIAVIPRQQTAAVGRSNNQWLSPPGCVMFSVQLHINMNTPLTSRFPLLQHIIGAAMANTLRSHELYGVLDVGLKWPNDIYANGAQKIGGLVVNTTLKGATAIVNMGCAINLDNSKPTVCINDMITDYNRNNNQKLPLLKYEQFIALTFNEIERLVAQVQMGDFDGFYELYYSLWLHDEQSIKICINKDQQQEATIVGIDENGFLKVKLPNGSIETVQPDGNSFDMLKGLIVPKYH